MFSFDDGPAWLLDDGADGNKDVLTTATTAAATTTAMTTARRDDSAAVSVAQHTHSLAFLDDEDSNAPAVSPPYAVTQAAAPAPAAAAAAAGVTDVAAAVAAARLELVQLQQQLTQSQQTMATLDDGTHALCRDVAQLTRTLTTLQQRQQQYDAARQQQRTATTTAAAAENDADTTTAAAEEATATLTASYAQRIAQLEQQLHAQQQATRAAYEQLQAQGTHDDDKDSSKSGDVVRAAAATAAAQLAQHLTRCRRASAEATQRRTRAVLADALATQLHALATQRTRALARDAQTRRDAVAAQREADERAWAAYAAAQHRARRERVDEMFAEVAAQLRADAEAHVAQTQQRLAQTHAAQTQQLHTQLASAQEAVQRAGQRAADEAARARDGQRREVQTLREQLAAQRARTHAMQQHELQQAREQLQHEQEQQRRHGEGGAVTHDDNKNTDSAFVADTTDSSQVRDVAAGRARVTELQSQLEQLYCSVRVHTRRVRAVLPSSSLSTSTAKHTRRNSNNDNDSDDVAAPYAALQTRVEAADADACAALTRLRDIRAELQHTVAALRDRMTVASATTHDSRRQLQQQREHCDAVRCAWQDDVRRALSCVLLSSSQSPCGGDTVTRLQLPHDVLATALREVTARVQALCAQQQQQQASEGDGEGGCAVALLARVDADVARLCGRVQEALAQTSRVGVAQMRVVRTMARVRALRVACKVAEARIQRMRWRLLRTSRAVASQHARMTRQLQRCSGDDDNNVAAKAAAAAAAVARTTTTTTTATSASRSSSRSDDKDTQSRRQGSTRNDARTVAAPLQPCDDDNDGSGDGSGSSRGRSNSNGGGSSALVKTSTLPSSVHNLPAHVDTTRQHSDTRSLRTPSSELASQLLLLRTGNNNNNNNSDDHSAMAVVS